MSCDSRRWAQAGQEASAFDCVILRVQWALSISVFYNSRLTFPRGKKLPSGLRVKNLAIVKENMFVAQMGNYLTECGLIYSLFSKDLMIPSQWHFLRKVCSSDPQHHPGHAGNTSPMLLGRGGEKGACNRRIFQGRQETKQDSRPLGLCLTPECPTEPTRHNGV